MGLVIRLIELLIVVVPVIGLIFAGMKAVSAAQARRTDEEDPQTELQARSPIRTDSHPPAVSNQSAHWQAIARTVKEQDRTDTRWLEYELDIAKVLDFPLMTDMRDPLTVRFHQAKLRADLLRPTKAEDLLEDRDAAREYLDAVENYATAFNVAEAEAIRRKRSGFTDAEQQRLARAQNMLRVASDSAATPQEREQAYTLAGRELDGLVVLPERARAAIERAIAGELDA